MTFEELYKELYIKYKVARWDYVAKKFKVRDVTTIGTWELFDLIDGLKETYAPKIKMTSEQKEEFFEFLEDSNEGFPSFWFAYGEELLTLYRFSEKDLMRAWLHPELIEMSDD